MSIYKQPYEKYPKLHPLELRGTEGMEVKLIDWTKDPYMAIHFGITASWRPWDTEITRQNKEKAIKTISDLAGGKIWGGQALEAPSFTFAIKNISRACTHQLVRVRVGAGFMQESGREGKWHEANFITPLTILENEEAHKKYVEKIVADYEWYKEMQTQGIPPQDARMSMPHAVAQNMWMTMNFAALSNFLNNRLCTTMQWEINTLARMLRDEITRKFPLLGKTLTSNCVKKGGCKSLTPYYALGAENNGNKVYYNYEAHMCGKASDISDRELNELVFNDMTNFLKD